MTAFLNTRWQDNLVLTAIDGVYYGAASHAFFPCVESVV